ncbi:MAG: 30S ribosomal protein S3 [Bacilli bacterium]|nr:30S ribosomal protein S3 [Bacilli bacterium]
MGQKVNANGLRIGINRGWQSNWYATKKQYAALLAEDIAIRDYLEPKLKDAVVSHIDIGRSKTNVGHKVAIVAYVAHQGVIIGQDNTKINAIKADLEKIVKSGEMSFEVLGVKDPDLDATLISKWIASELENRQSFRSTQKKAMQRIRKAGAVGCRTQCQGRLGGAEIARREGYKDGVVPLETLRADIDYAHTGAATAYGRIGVKVWICRSTNKGDSPLKEEEQPVRPARRNPRDLGGNDNASAKTH